MKRLAFLVVFLVLGAFAVAATSVYAVTTTGKINGVVTDPNGLTVANAKVSVTNIATNVSLTTQTGSDGGYEVPNLPPGKYRVTIESQGFRTSVHENVIVQVDVPTRVDASLELGAVTQTITVTEGLAKVETSNIALGGTVNASLMTGLPLVNRNYTDLVFTQPGVVASSDRFTNNPSVNGGRSQANNFLIEGVDNNDLPLNTPLAQPSPDSLEEFRLITNTINPEYARNSGAIVNAVTKSGDNRFHGDAFWFYRGKGLNSNDFFNNLAGRPKPDFNRNLWGLTVGGPAYLPKVYNGRNKTFWFFSYQGVHEVTPQPTTASRVYTAAERDLNNTGLADWSAGCPRFQASDPCFTKRAGAGKPLENVGTSIVPFFDSNGASQPAGTPYSVLWPNGRIPTSNFGPVARGILAGFPNLNIPGIPLPNSPGSCGRGVAICNFTASFRSPLENYQVSVKGDQNFGGGHRLSGYYFRQTQTTSRPIPFTGSTVPGFGDHSLSIISRASITYTHILNSHTTNEGRIGWNRLRFGAVLPNNVFDPKKIGFTGINVNDPTVASAPNIQILQGWFNYGFSRNGPQPRVDETFHYIDNLSYISGAHSLKFGFDIRQQRISNPFFFAHNGRFFCRGSGVSGESTGVAGLDFLLNNCETFQQGSPGQNFARSNGYYFYGQDVWRINPTFTLTYGMGYVLEQPYEQLAGNRNNLNAFRPGVQSVVFPAGTPQNPGTGPFIGAPKGLLYPSDPGIPRGTIPFRKKNFAPRVGIAWSPSSDVSGLHFLTGGRGKFSVRAGYGIYYNVIEEETSLQFLFTFPFALIKTTSLPNLANPYLSRTGGTTSNPFPYIPPTPGTPNVDFFPALPLNTSVLDPTQKLPNSQNWNLTIDRELPANALLRVAYVGSKGTHLVSREELLDTPGRQLLSRIDPVLGNTTNCPSNRPQGCVWQSLGLQTTNSNSSYQSFQLSVEKRASRGLYLLAAYTLGKSLDTNSGFEDGSNTPRNPARDRGFSAFDARQRLVLTYTWDIPGPKTGLLGRVAGGWSLNGITTFQGGFPVEIVAGSNRCDPVVTFSFFGTWCRPDLVGPIVKSDPRASSNQQYFNPSAFKDPAVPSAGGTDTLQQQGNSPRTFFHGPGINNWDFAILKRVSIDEARYLHFRVEFYNGFNHAQFILGSLTSPNLNGNSDSGNFGRATAVRTIQGAQRVIQLSAKFYF